MKKIIGMVYNGAIELFSSLFLVVMFCVVVYGVAMRHFSSRPPFWTDELARYCMFYMVMLGSAVCIRDNIHPALTFITDGMKGGWRVVRDMWVETLVLLTVVFLFYGGYEMMVDARKARTAALRMYYSRVYFAIPLGSALMGIACVARIIGVIKGRKDAPVELPNLQT